MEQPLPQCWSTNSVPRAFFLRVAIGCRLSLKIDRNLSPSLAGTLSVATWYDSAWIGGTASGTLYRSVDLTVLPAQSLRSSANGMNHCLPSRSWYSFTDPGKIGGWFMCYIHNVVRITLQWGSSGRPTVGDLGWRTTVVEEGRPLVAELVAEQEILSVHPVGGGWSA